MLRFSISSIGLGNDSYSCILISEVKLHPGLKHGMQKFPLRMKTAEQFIGIGENLHADML